MLGIVRLFQPLILPSLVVVTAWATAMIVIKKDSAVGFSLYLGLIVVADSYFKAGLTIPGLSYGTIRYSEVVLIFLFAAAPPARPRTGVHRFITALVALYFLLFFLAAMRGYTALDGLNNFRGIIVPQILAFVIASRGLRNADDYRRCFSFLIVLLVLTAVFTVWDAFFDIVLFHSDSMYAPEYVVNRAHGRFGSFFLNPIDLGDFSVLVLPVMLLTARLQRSAIRRAGFGVGLLLFAFAFVKTQSRGAMLGFGVALMFFTLLPYKGFPRYRRGVSVIMAALLLSLLMPGFYATATKRFDSIQEESSMDEVDRASTWNHVIANVIPMSPVFGIGLGEKSFIQIMRQTGYEAEFGRTLDNPHSSYLEIAVAAGCLTLVIFLGINAFVIVTNIGFLRQTGEKALGMLVLGISSGVLGFLVATASGQDMFRVSVAPIYWTMIGFSLSITSNPTFRLASTAAAKTRETATAHEPGQAVAPAGPSLELPRPGPAMTAGREEAAPRTTAAHKARRDPSTVVVRFFGDHRDATRS